MGDFFDFWFGFPDPTPLIRTYADLIEMLKGFRREGIRVIYLEGNHDFALGRYMRDEIGLEIHECSFEMELDGKQLFLAHGDRIYPTLGHRLVASILRSRLAYLVITLLGARSVTSIARRWSAVSRRRNMKRSPVVIARLRAFAERKISEGFDVVILAHTHLAEAITIKGKGRVGYYFNVGDWIKDFSYLRYNARQGFSLRYAKIEGMKNERS